VALLRFIVYAALIVAVLTRVVHVTQSTSPELARVVSGRTSQDHIVSLSFKHSRLVSMSVEWFADCGDGATWGPYQTNYSSNDLDRIGPTIKNTWRHAAARDGVAGTALESLNAHIGEGLTARGDFGVTARFGRRHGRRITCRTGALRWNVP
jgi:hypothetical protein